VDKSWANCCDGSVGVAIAKSPFFFGNLGTYFVSSQ